MTVLEAKDVSVERGGRLILSSSSIAAQTGELLVLVGPNGSGKSTLLRLLAGLWKPKTGSILLDGQPLHRSSRNDIARRIAFVPQDTHVDFNFTVDEILAMGRYPHRGRFAPENAADRAAIQTAAEMCDVADLRHRSIGTLSGGERQRTLIARSLAVQPEFVLLDEPTANLDIEHTLEILELGQTLAACGRSVILATHDLNLAVRYGTRVALLSSGRIQAVGSPDEVFMGSSLERVFNVQSEKLRTQAGSYVFNFSIIPE